MVRGTKNVGRKRLFYFFTISHYDHCYVLHSSLLDSFPPSLPSLPHSLPLHFLPCFIHNLYTYSTSSYARSLFFPFTHFSLHILRPFTHSPFYFSSPSLVILTPFLSLSLSLHVPPQFSHFHLSLSLSMPSSTHYPIFL